MTHSFDVDMAEKYGIEQAILIYNLDFWLTKNMANEKNFHDGSYWTYNSGVAFERLFPYMRKRKIYRLLKDMEAAGIINTGNYNANKYDRTKWYSFTDEFVKMNTSILRIGKMEITQRENGNTESVTPIPDSKPDRNKKEEESPSGDGTLLRGMDKKVSEAHIAIAETIASHAEELDAKKFYRQDRQKTVEKWADAIRLLEEQDGREPAEIKDILTWAINDDFWSRNILSGEKFRKQFSTLMMQKNGKRQLTDMEQMRRWAKMEHGEIPRDDILDETTEELRNLARKR